MLPNKYFERLKRLGIIENKRQGGFNPATKLLFVSLISSPLPSCLSLSLDFNFLESWRKVDQKIVVRIYLF